ncbi:DNA cytosine methyltransferase [Pseudomonas inefficax]|uniref:DNA cytosine methyltransferase n=1 Tax=Pseudomonas inefficax TaxID=2078786 RepID=UPI00207B9DEF|nr:DNA cytosine methyltransferase [Pseudomonas inefficax]MCM8913220.1 DNA cytosine methyltransferase [Pseudomonas inefficax]
MWHYLRGRILFGQEMKPLAIDLFCGAGGLSEGLKAAGFKVLAGVELHPVAAETYRHNHPDHVLFEGDICDLDPMSLMKELELAPGELDLLAGCPPCQGFSTHRTRNKLPAVDDARNNLVFEYLKFVEVFLPKVVMMENVPALATDGRAHKILSTLKALGYVINSKTLQVKNAADYGVPQRRKRMILIASRFGVIAEPAVVKEHSSVSNYIADLPAPGEKNDALHDYFPVRTKKTQQIISLVPKNGGSRTDLPKEFWLPCHLRRNGGYLDVYGRMAWEKVSPTLTGGCINPSKGRFIHPEQDRAITLREAALLQTFPDDYYFSLGRGRDFAALMIGNALPPLFIEVHARKIRQHIKEIR